MTRRSHRVAALILSIFATLSLGCLVPTPRQVPLSEVRLEPPMLMVERKVPTKLYIVLDPAEVPTTVPRLFRGEDKGHGISELHTFVSRDLKVAMGGFFEEVEIIGPEALSSLDTTPHVIMKVRLGRIEMVEFAAGYVDELNWAASLQVSEHKALAYSFAGKSHGKPGQDEIRIRSMLEQAITDFVGGYLEKNVHAALVSAFEEGETPANRSL